MLSASLLKGDVPEDKTIADLLQVQERDGDERVERRDPTAEGRRARTEIG